MNTDTPLNRALMRELTTDHASPLAESVSAMTEPAGPVSALGLGRGSPAVVRTRVHMCLCVSGALRWKDSRLAGLFTKEDGSECTGREAREYLKLQDYLGRRVIPVGDCDNFDYNTGCRGHPEQENNGDVPTRT